MMRKLMFVTPLLAIALSLATSAAAQGPYYATPSWDQTLACDVGNCPRFVSSMSNTAVLDRETGLVWDKDPHVIVNGFANVWSTAQAVCLGSFGAGADVQAPRKGWRLPTIQELASLVDKTHTNPALPAGHPFSIGGGFGSVWSATTDAGDASNAWTLDFSDGLITSVPKGGDGQGRFAWCVRGGLGVNSQ